MKFKEETMPPFSEKELKVLKENHELLMRVAEVLEMKGGSDEK